MTIFYIKTQSAEVFELTATTDVAFQHRNTNTKFPVESGVSITDHSIIENSTFSLAGVITDVVQLTQYSPVHGVKDYIEGLDKIRKNKETFTVFLDNRLSPYKNCMFTELSGTKGVMEGLGSWRINIGIEQVRFVDKAKASLVKVAGETTADDGTNASDATKDSVSGKTDAGSKPTLEKSLTRKAIDAGKPIAEQYLGGVTPPDGTTGAG